MNLFLRLLLGLTVLVIRLVQSFVFLFVPRSWRYKDLSGDDVILVTGGGSGLGRAIALAFAVLGPKVVVWDLDQSAAEETGKMIQEIGGKGFSYKCDVADRSSVYQMALKVRSEVGKVTVLVNNAGIVVGKRLLDLPDEKIEKVFAVNTLAHFWTCKAFLPDMMTANRGNVVNISSMAGFAGINKLTDYCASKHAVNGLSESLTLELRVGGFSGVCVTAVCPFVIATGLFDGFDPGFLPVLKTEEVAREVVSSVLSNERIVILPRFLSPIVALKNFIPAEAQLSLADLFDCSAMMSNFRGGRPTTVNHVTFQNGQQKMNSGVKSKRRGTQN